MMEHNGGEKKYFKDIFLKYQRRLLNEEEKELFIRWLIHLNINDHEFEENMLLEKQQLSAAELRNARIPDVTINNPIWFSGWIRTIAATVLTALTILGLFYTFHKKISLNNVEPIYTEVVTHRGEMKILTLTDGTKITLNNESRIRFPSALTGKAREVFLTGEAFFEVVHNAAKPFMVHTDKVKVQVLGTTFDVKAYPKDRGLYVSVASGRVAVMAAPKNSRPFFLMRGDQLSYNRSNEKSSVLKIDADAITSWQNGTIIFNNEPISGITNELERLYGVTFLIRNKSLLAKEISIKIKNQSLNSVMKALSISGEFKYRIEGGKVIIW